jgi:hypothetical protein
MESAFEDTKQYVLTEIGSQFVHYMMTELVGRLNSGQRKQKSDSLDFTDSRSGIDFSCSDLPFTCYLLPKSSAKASRACDLVLHHRML